MSTQDKIERILKEIHVLFSDGETVSGKPEQVIVDRKEALAILEKLNLAVYEMMDQYEVTAQSRELAQRRSEKQGEAMLERVSNQAEDVYAASLIYTDDALNRVQYLMADALRSSQEIWRKLSRELEQEKRRVKEDQLELREQLQDFKDSNKYLVMIEECNREREKEQQAKESKGPEKRIQNEAKHYAMKIKPEIKVNPAYFERRGLTMQKDDEVTLENDANDIPPMPQNPVKEENERISHGVAAGDIPPMPQSTEETPVKPFVMPEIKVDLDAEYFKWQAQEGKGNSEEAVVDEKTPASKAAMRKEWKTLFGRK